jgi:hypothetical protein
LAHIASRLKVVKLEEIQDITSDMIDKLRKLNINSVYQLAVQIPSELAFEISDTSIDIESAARLIGNARKILTENDLLSKEFSTADDMLEINRVIEFRNFSRRRFRDSGHNRNCW